MDANTSKESLSNKLQNWTITLFIIFISLGGLTLALICIYALPDKSVQPLTGSIFFACATGVVIGLLFYSSKRGKLMYLKSGKGIDFNTPQIIVQESVSDIIIKWLVTIFSGFFALWGFMVALVCIYALPDKTVQPVAGIVYFFSGAIVVCTFIVVAWRNLILRKE